MRTLAVPPLQPNIKKITLNQLFKTRNYDDLLNSAYFLIQYTIMIQKEIN